MALGLGSNVGPSEELLALTVGELRRRLGALSVASLYRSAPLSPIDQADYLNTAVVLAEALARLPSGLLGAETLLAQTKALELAAGRRRGPRDGPRPLDIDLLVFGDLRANRPELILPHPRLHERRFVLLPLADLVPDLPLPPNGITAPELLDRLGSSQEVERIGWRTPP